MSDDDQKILTESDLEAKEVSTEQEVLPEIIIREILTIDEIIKSKGYVNIFEENFLGYLQGLLKNRSKAEIFNKLYERYRVDQNIARPEEECYIPVLANIRDTIDHRVSQIEPGNQVKSEHVDEFTKLYINYRKTHIKDTEPDFKKRLENYLLDPFTLPLLNMNVAAEEQMTEYIAPRPNQHVCVGENTDDVMVLSGHIPSFHLRRVNTAYRAPVSTENATMADRQKVAVDAITPAPTLDIPTFDGVLESLTPDMESHDIMVALERSGFPLFYMTPEDFTKLKERLEVLDAAPVEPVPDYGTAAGAAGAMTHEERIKEYWDILRRAVDSVSSRIRNRPVIVAPEDLPTPPLFQESIEFIEALKTYKRETYQKIIHDIYQDYQITSVNVDRTASKIAWDKFIEPWIKYVYSYDFQFVKLYNEIEEIRISEDTRDYIGTIYDNDGIVADVGDAVDAIDDDIGGENPFKELDYGEGEAEAEAEGEVAAAAGAEAPSEYIDPILKYTVIDDYLMENSSDFYIQGTLVNDIIVTLKTFITFWIYNTGLSKYFNPKLLKLAIKPYENKNSRVDELKTKLANKNVQVSYNNYQANYYLEKPKGVSEKEWKIIKEYTIEVDLYFIDACKSFLVDLAYKWSEYLLNNYILNVKLKHGIFPEINMTTMQRPYWDPFGFPCKDQNKNALLSPGLLKYLSVTAQQTMNYLLLSGRKHISNNVFFNIYYYNNITYGEYFYKYLNRCIESTETMNEIPEANKRISLQQINYHKYFSMFEYDLFKRDYKLITETWIKVKDELEKINPDRILQTTRCDATKLVQTYMQQILKNNKELYNTTLTPDIASEYAKVYRCLASMVLSQQDNKNILDKVLSYNEYMKEYYYKGRMIFKIGSNFEPDIDWKERITKTNDANALTLLLIKNKIKYNRFAYIPKYELFSYSKKIPSIEKNIEKEVEAPPISDITPDVVDPSTSPVTHEVIYSMQNYIKKMYENYVRQVTIPEYKEFWIYQSVSTKYTFYKTLSKRLLKSAYLFNKRVMHNTFRDNLNKIIAIQEELNNIELNTKDLSKIYRDLCVLITYVNNWESIIIQQNYTKAIIKESDEFFKQWSAIPTNYNSVNDIITQQREKNKIKQLEEGNALGQEQQNLRRELISKGFKK